LENQQRLFAAGSSVLATVKLLAAGRAVLAAGCFATLRAVFAAGSSVLATVRLFAAASTVLAAGCFTTLRAVFTTGSAVLAAVGFLTATSLLSTTGRLLLAAIRGFSTGTHTTSNKQCQGKDCEDFLHWLFSYWLILLFRLTINQV